ncbi:hypothetical protein [Paraliobacillus zengyii]|uniref:hypothetical protein n=1 Tax=Paraliobacillus zengyii TaxID=2213194 RepID=UPI000DD40511|nr:hypothetical protein [Paraliobacillus zengyii]
MSNKLTVDEIKKQLDEKEIDYKSNMNRDELLSLLEGDSEDQTESETDTKETPSEEVEKEEDKPKQYVVIHDFKDLEDRDIIYTKDDIYPKRTDSEISDKRIQELMSDQNKIGKPLIKEQG